MEPLFYLGFLLASIYVISKSSDLFIEAASSLGVQLKLKDYLIGSLIVGVGTSLPELITSLAAIYEKEPILVAPNVFGTIIANIGAGLGLSVICLHFFVPDHYKTHFFTTVKPYCNGVLNFESKSKERGDSFDTPIVFAIFSVFLSYFLCMDGTFSRIDAGIFLLAYLAFLVNEISERKREVEPHYEENNIDTPPLGKVKTARYVGLKILGGDYISFFLFLAFSLFVMPFDRVEYLVVFLAGLGAIVYFETNMFRKWIRQGAPASLYRFKESVLIESSKLTLVMYIALSLVVVFWSGSIIVSSVIFFADYFGVSSTVLAASVIAVGTSLPDIVVAIKVARKGRHQLLIGHIIQSNVFDVFLIMAVCGLIVPLPIDAQTIKFTILFAIVMTVALLPIVRDNKVTLPEGIMMFIAYGVFIGVLFGAI